MTLRITPARKELLQAIADGAVVQRYPMLPANPETIWDLGPGHDRRRKVVTAKAEALREANLARPGKPDTAYYKSQRTWILTAAGEEALALAGGKP